MPKTQFYFMLSVENGQKERRQKVAGKVYKRDIRVIESRCTICITTLCSPHPRPKRVSSAGPRKKKKAPATHNNAD